MNLWDIVKTVGTGIISNVVPGGSAIVGLVNEFLPDDNKLPATATGEQVQSALNAIPPDERAAIMSKEFDVEIEDIRQSHSTVRAMLESDAANPHTTRPYIAKHSFHVVAFTIVLVMLVWGYGVFKGDAEMVKAVQSGWPFVVAIIGTPTTLLLAYFGRLTKEHKQRMDAANGAAPATGLAGLISSFVKKN